jgi:alginate O-acetyltransferase complex protein AlgI
MELLLHIVDFAVINLNIVLLGYLLVNRSLVLLSWMMLIASIAAVYFIFLHHHPIIKMLTIIATTFTAMKVIAVAESYKGKKVKLYFKQWVVFTSGWAGMRAGPFETLGGPPLPNAWPMIRFGISRIIFGSLLILLANLIVRMYPNHNTIYIPITALLLVGFSLILHFGLLSISAGAWRLSGANTYL